MRAVDPRALSTNDEDDRSQLDVVCVPPIRVYMTDSSARDQPVNPFILLADCTAGPTGGVCLFASQEALGSNYK